MKKYLYKTKKESSLFKCVLVPIFFLLAGCATTGTEITNINNRISTPTYSITIPAKSGWKMEKITDDPNVTYVEKTMGSNNYTMRLSINKVIQDYMKSWTEKQVADNYRNGEKANMIARGVMTGMYTLKDVKMGKKKVGNKLFYTMDYTAVKNKVEQSASLYLYFPKKRNIGTFFVSLYLESSMSSKPLSQSFKNEFLETLNSLEMK